MNSEQNKNARVVLITGMSGAGKSRALDILEDLGFETVDNIPLSLLRNLVRPVDDTPPGERRPLAIGVDYRTRDFGADAFLRELDALGHIDGVSTCLVFIDCDDHELARRYKETRRRHPLAHDRPVADCIRQERALLERIRERANDMIDTSDTSIADFSRLMRTRFEVGAPEGLTVFVTSFGFKNGLPRDADLVFDVRFLRNPYYDPDLRPQTGADAPVAAYIAADPSFEAFFANLGTLLDPLLPRYREEGKSYLTIGVGCTGGQHRSVFVAERLADHLAEMDWPVTLSHRDMKR